MCVLLMICSRLDTSTNLHARLMAAEGEVAPRDVLEHVREVVDHGGAGRAPTPALARLLVGRVATEAEVGWLPLTTSSAGNGDAASLLSGVDAWLETGVQ